MSATTMPNADPAAPTGIKRIIKVRWFKEGDEELVQVPLFGVDGTGHHMVLDASVWHEGLAAGWPAAWIAQYEPKSKKTYVVTCRKPLIPRGVPVSLSRTIMNAQRGKVIAFRDGDGFNLRKSNLIQLTGRQAREHRFGRPIYFDVIEEVEDTPNAAQDDLGVPW
jgi:hypothetical protein